MIMSTLYMSLVMRESVRAAARTIVDGAIEGPEVLRVRPYMQHEASDLKERRST